MKKTLLLASLVCVNLYAKLGDDEILSLFNPPSNVKISIESRSSLENTPFEKIVILVKGDDDSQQRQILFSDGKYIFPDVVDIKEKGSYLNKFTAEENLKNKKISYEKLSKVLKAYPKDKIIEIGDKNKELVYIFTDPLCPYCQEELKHIQTRLKEVRMKVVLTPIASHGEDAIVRSLAIQDEVKKAKNDEEKIKIFKKYYDIETKSPKYSQDAINAERELIESIFKTNAIRGVPSFIEAESLKL